MRKIILLFVLIASIVLFGCSLDKKEDVSNNICDTTRGYVGIDGKCYCNSGYSLYGRVKPQCLTTGEFYENVFKVKNGNSNNGLSQDELFQKKKECSTYKEKIEKEIKNQIEKENGKTLKQLGVYIYLKEIFYSPKRNSCLYVYNNQNNGFSNYFLVDYFTKEFIMGYGENLSSPKYIEQFNKEMKELKGE